MPRLLGYALTFAVSATVAAYVVSRIRRKGAWSASTFAPPFRFSPSGYPPLQRAQFTSAVYPEWRYGCSTSKGNHRS